MTILPRLTAKLTSALAALVLTAGCVGSEPDAPKTPYEQLIRDYANEVVPLWSRWREAEWRAHTEVIPGDSQRSQQAVAAYEQWRARVTDPKWVRAARDLQTGGSAPTVGEKAALDALFRVTRQLPAAEAELLTRIDEKVGLQQRFRKRAVPRIDGEPVVAEELVRRLGTALDPAERKASWRALLGPAGDLKPSYAELRDLRNDLARKGSWPNHLDSVTDPYRMTSVEMLQLMAEVEIALRPLFQELHTWARGELANRYVQAPPELIPADWLPTPVGDDWGGLATLDQPDVAPALQSKGGKVMLQGVEAWFTGVGLPPLSQAYWERSSLYPVPPGARVGKTLGAATWDIDLAGDVRTLMSAKPTPGWMSAAYRELAYAHAYTLRADARLYPPIRMQPPDAVLQSLGAWADLAATRPATLVANGLLDKAPPEMPMLLGEALSYVVFVQFGAGVVVPFEFEVYGESLAPGQMNSRWWGLVARHMGVYPPETRTERWADFLSVDALQDAPGRYAEHVLAVLLAFQIHEAVCQQAGLDPRTADISKNPKAGEVFTRLALGAGVQDWRVLMQEVTGSAPSADAMVRYFQPLQSWLSTQNANRAPTLPPLR